MKRILRIAALLLFLLPGIAKAQWTFDIVSVEAYINDHKKQRSLLLARSTLEYSNKLLHEYSCKEVGGYKELNIDLDRYTRAFDVIDVMYQSLRTVLNVKNTYTSVSDRIGDYKSLLEDFNAKILKRGRIESADTLIISINARGLRAIAREGEQLYKSVSDLVLYATGAAGSLLDLRPADGVGGHQPLIGQHRAASEPCVFRDMAVYTGAYRLLEGKGISLPHHAGDSR